MAKGDVKSYRGRGGWGGGGGYDYDDEGRGASKSVWENFRDDFEASGYECSWLFTIEHRRCYNIITKTTWRYNVADGPQYWDRRQAYGFNLADKLCEDDSRIARLVKKKCGEDTWLKFYHHLLDGYEKRNEELKEERKNQERKYADQRREWKEQEAEREAERVKELEAHNAQLSKEVELVTGAIRSEFNTAFSSEESFYQRQGDYLDDVVAGHTSGYGFSEEVRAASGIKLQITVSLDLSNSNYYNKVHTAAAEAFRNICLSLEALKQEHSGSLDAAYFIFAIGEDGKAAYRLEESERERWYLPYFIRSRLTKVSEHLRLPALMDAFRYPEKLDTSMFNGEDTWIMPLFEKIEKWEHDNDPGACRLDLVITDAVLEHPTDIRKSSIIQERRDGNLQTVFLNLLPEDDWEEQSLPYRCVQYPVNKDNLGGLLRLVLQQFVSVYL